MPSRDLLMSVEVRRTPRVMQIEGLFDVPPSARSETRLRVDLDPPEPWNIGLIVGPSGSGKTSVARACFGDHLVGIFSWPRDASLIDAFPGAMSIRDVAELLSSVGFGSPPAWLRPFHALSTGEQFRVSVARAMAEAKNLIVLDEFTSVVDRTVARIGSAAIARTIRRRGLKLIAVTCHYDVAEWLEPDWVYQPHLNRLDAGRSLHRPPIRLEIRRVPADAWALFRHHHYLDTSLHCASRCFAAFWNGEPVAFAAILHFPHASRIPIKREHRVVCLPDFQGVGIGNALSAWCGSLCRGLGCRYLSITSHPGMMRSRAASPLWRMISAPNNRIKSFPRQSPGRRGRAGPGSGRAGPFTGRLRGTFEYVGPKLDREKAESLWS